MVRSSKKVYVLSIAIVFFGVAGCSDSPSNSPEPEPSALSGEVPEVVDPDIVIDLRAEKISQLVGDFDRDREEPTGNRTNERYKLRATDLGVPFQDEEQTWILFGDTWGEVGGDRDVIAYTTDTNLEDGLSLDFISDESGTYTPIDIPGISQGAFEVPTEGLMIDDQMYIYHTTNHSPPVTMGRSVLARSKSGNRADFEYLYDFSTRYFINVSIVQLSASDWFRENKGIQKNGLMIFGSDNYRKSEVYLAYQPASEIENTGSIQYFAGVDEEDEPLWESSETKALPVFNLDSSCVGELSVSYNQYIDRWILLYNCGDPRGINMRTAKDPWGPWTESQVLFEPWEDGGYCNFIHTSWEHEQCDSVHDPGRENEWGGEYGPYQFEHLATGDNQSTTIYFTMSTWNPYTVVLMKARLRKKGSTQ